MFKPTLGAVGAALTLALAACGDSGNDNGNSNGGGGESAANAQKAIDINPQPRDNVKDGGTIRWAIDQFSTQWNYNQLNGPEASTLDVFTALMPQPLLADEKANTEVNPDFLESAEQTSDSPQTIRYVLNK